MAAQFGSLTSSLVFLVLLNVLGFCEMSVYPGLRRKPLQQSLQQPFDVPSDFLTQLMEENARRRLQQQFEQQLELIRMQMNRKHQRQLLRERYRQQKLRELAENNEDEYNSNNNNHQFEQYDNGNSEYSYKYPSEELDASVLLPQSKPFAVGPFDPRFYEEDNQDDGDLDSRALDDYEEYVPAEKVNSPDTTDVNTNEINTVGRDAKPIGAATPVLAPTPVETSNKLLDISSTNNFHKIKPHTAAAAAVAGVNVATMKNTPGGNDPSGDTNLRQDINALIVKLQKEGKAHAILNHEDLTDSNDQNTVIRQHLGREGDMGLHMVIMIASVSAAITAALIWLGFAWFRNRSKAAADVEYPAYGVTGPNKDISPSADRKLAQSAQMYHYQHQKQQIIAMENRQAVEGSCGLSDVESDDDNEEGDYTVYECPGLAPTGEMEVKNPLFLDETPMTPSNTVAAAAAANNNITQATPQQPQTLKKSGKVAPTAPMAPSSEEKNKKKNKK